VTNGGNVVVGNVVVGLPAVFVGQLG